MIDDKMIQTAEYRLQESFCCPFANVLPPAPPKNEYACASSALRDFCVKYFFRASWRPRDLRCGGSLDQPGLDLGLALALGDPPPDELALAIGDGGGRHVQGRAALHAHDLVLHVGQRHGARESRGAGDL